MEYMIFLTAFVFSIILNIIMIPALRIIKAGQSVRTLGPKEHYKKNGTPTMGGIVIILSFILIYLLFIFYYDLFNYKVLMLVFPVLFFGFIGFIDDYLKVVKRNNDGISPLCKFMLQLIFSIIYIIIFYKHLNTNVKIFKLNIDFGYFYYLFIIFIFASTTNAVNISDGLDGLVSGEVLIILASVLYICDSINVSLFMISLIGAILAFLCYNVYPAKIFMGDVGSLGIGGAIASIFIVLKIEILLIVFCFVMVFEIISVILQVLYFKITKGKRLFKMAPFHHHLELSGIKEIEVSIILWCLTGIFCMFGLLFYNYFF